MIAKADGAQMQVFEKVLSTTSTSYTFSEKINTTQFADEKYNLRVTVYDACGNETTRTFGEFLINNTPPQKVENVNATVISAVKAVLRWDDVPDDDRSSYSVYRIQNGTPTLVAQNIQTIESETGKLILLLSELEPQTTYSYVVSAIDQCNNEGEKSDVCTFTTEEDTVAPVIINPPAAARVKSSLTYKAEAVDNIGYLASITVQTSPDAENWTNVETKAVSGTRASATFILSLNGYSDGNFFVRAVAKDRAGNESTTNAYTQYYVDNTPPTTPVGVQAVGHEGYVEISWTDNSEADKDVYRVERATSEAGTYSTLKSNLRQTNYYDTTPELGQTYYYRVYVKDTVGNESAASEVVSAKVSDDTIAPQVTGITGGANGVASTNYASLTVNASDNRAINRLYVGYKKAGDTDYTALYDHSGLNRSSVSQAVTLPMGGFATGDVITVLAFVVDTQGNQSESFTKTYTVDKTAPGINDFACSLDGDTVTLSWTGYSEDDLSGYTVYCGSTIIATKAKGATGFTYSLTGRSTGDYTFKVLARDKVGNTSTTEQKSVHYVNEAVVETQIVDEEDQVVVVNVFADFDYVANMELGVQEYFTSTSYSSLNDISYWKWDFGDGSAVAFNFRSLEAKSHAVAVRADLVSGRKKRIKQSETTQLH